MARQPTPAIRPPHSSCPGPQICQQYSIEKIKTIGDCYMCVAWEDWYPPAVMAKNALRAAERMHGIIAVLPCNDRPMAIRVGVHGGPAVSGIIGKSRFCFDMWGVCRAAPPFPVATIGCAGPLVAPLPQKMRDPAAARPVPCAPWPPPRGQGCIRTADSSHFPHFS